MDDITIIIAPSERHPAMRAIADDTSNLPEQYGCDALWRANGKWWGVQRKEITDFIASIQDGRLAKEVGQMRGHVTMPIVVIEGRPQWSAEGALIYSTHSRQVITHRAWRGMIFSLLNEEVNVLFTKDTQDTAETINDLAAWSQKDHHNSMLRRPGPDVTSMWGKATNKDWARHLLQSFPGIGATVADEILAYFGRVPMSWDVPVSELIKIPGIGKGRAKALIEAFNPLEES